MSKQLLNTIQTRYQAVGAKMRELREWELAQRDGARLPTAPPKLVERVTPTTTPPAEAPVVETERPVAKPLTLDDVLAAVNDDVDNLPHLILYGDSGSGKTFLAQLVAGSRPGQLVILDPKRPQGWKGPKWGGLPYVCRAKGLPEGLDLREFLARSYAPLVAALHSVVAEMVDRYDRQESQREPFEQLTVVLDEARNSVSESPELAELYKKIISIGREVNVRLILLSTTDRVGPLGFAGEGDAMDSLGEIRLGLFAVNVKRELAHLADEGTKYLRAVFYRGGRWVPFDNAGTAHRLKALRLSADRVWPGVAYNCQLPVDDAKLLDGLLSEATQSVKPFSLELPSEDFSTELYFQNGWKSFPQHTNAVSEISGRNLETSESLENAVKQFAAAEISDRKLVLAALDMVYSGERGKLAAICHLAGVRPGRRYQQLAALYEVARSIRERSGK